MERFGGAAWKLFGRVGNEILNTSDIIRGRKYKQGFKKWGINPILGGLVDYGRKHSGRKSIGEEAMSSASYYLRKLGQDVARDRKRKKQGKIPYPSKRRKVAPRPKPANQAGSGPITTQSDVRVSKGMRKLSRKQKSWKTFVKKVQKAETSNDKTQFMIELVDDPLQITGTVGSEFQQVVQTTASGDFSNLMLNSIGNTATGPARYFNTLAVQPSITTAASVPRGSAAINQYFKVVYANATVSIENVAPTASYVDIYECIAASHITDINYSSARAAWVTCASLGVDDFAAAITSILTTTSGATPYAAPQFFKYWKIIKKTRLFMTTNEIINYTYHCRKNVNVSKNVQDGRYATKGVTKDLIIVANPTYNGDTTAVNQLNIEWQKSYGVKYPDMQGLQTQLALQFTYT